MTITYCVTQDFFNDGVNALHVDFVVQGGYPRISQAGWFEPLEAWCQEQFGPAGLEGGWWRRTGYTFRFRKLGHAVLFRLTWHGVEA